VYYLFPTLCRGLRRKREGNPAVGIEFTFEKKVFKNSTSYYGINRKILKRERQLRFIIRIK